MLDLTSSGYQITERLQENYLGGRQTYLASDLNQDLSVVVKQFAFARQGSSWSGYKALMSEIKMLCGLNHPRIPRFIETIEHPAGLCLVTSYIAGSSLEDKFLPETQIYQIVEELLDILIYLQSCSSPVIHGDIKPANVILGARKEVYLIDFGLSSTINSHTLSLSASFGGTIGYMPPEQIFKGKINLTTDLYALGTLMFELLCGRGLALRDLLDSRNQVPIELLEGKAKREVVDWLKRLLSESIEDRYLNARAAKAAWGKIDYPLGTLHHRSIGLEKLIDESKPSKKGAVRPNRFSLLDKIKKPSSTTIICGVFCGLSIAYIVFQVPSLLKYIAHFESQLQNNLQDTEVFIEQLLLPFALTVNRVLLYVVMSVSFFKAGYGIVVGSDEDLKIGVVSMASCFFMATMIATMLRVAASIILGT